MTAILLAITLFLVGVALAATLVVVLCMRSSQISREVDDAR